MNQAFLSSVAQSGSGFTTIVNMMELCGILSFVSTMVTWDNEHFKDKFVSKVLTPDEYLADLI